MKSCLIFILISASHFSCVLSFIGRYYNKSGSYNFCDENSFVWSHHKIIVDSLLIIIKEDFEETLNTTLPSALDIQSFWRSLDHLVEAAVDTDFGVLGRTPSFHFRGEHLKESEKLLKLRWQKILANIDQGKLWEARDLIGMSLASLQDFYSASNWLELANTDILYNLGLPNQVFMNVSAPTDHTCDSCYSNDPRCFQKLSQNIVAEKILTSYYAQTDVQKTPMSGKCFSPTRHCYSLSLNKHFPSVVRHLDLHDEAGKMAVKASVHYLKSIRAVIGRAKFYKIFEVETMQPSHTSIRNGSKNGQTKSKIQKELESMLGKSCNFPRNERDVCQILNDVFITRSRSLVMIHPIDRRLQRFKIPLDSDLVDLRLFIYGIASSILLKNENGSHLNNAMKVERTSPNITYVSIPEVPIFNGQVFLEICGGPLNVVAAGVSSINFISNVYYMDSKAEEPSLREVRTSSQLEDLLEDQRDIFIGILPTGRSFWTSIEKAVIASQKNVISFNLTEYEAYSYVYYLPMPKSFRPYTVTIHGTDVLGHEFQRTIILNVSAYFNKLKRLTNDLPLVKKPEMQLLEAASHRRQKRMMQDTTPPFITLISKSSCSDYHSKKDCDEKIWNARFRVQEYGSGLQSIFTEPGTSQYPVPVGIHDFEFVYTSECCHPKVTVFAVDLYQNTGTLTVTNGKIDVLSLGAIIGISVGGLVLIILLIILIVCCSRRATSKRKDSITLTRSVGNGQ